MTPAVRRRVLLTMALFGAAAFVSTLLAIWLREERWGETAAACIAAAFCCLLAWVNA